MKRRKVYFACVSNVFPVLPYQWGVLRAAAQTDPLVAAAYGFEDPFFLPERAEAMARRVRKPAVLGLSCFVWNLPLQMKLCRLVKKRHPGCVTVAGGPQIPRQADRFFQDHPYVDVLVHGEGEGPFRRLLAQLLRPAPRLDAVGGITYNRGQEAIYTGPDPAPLPRDISDARLPSPYLAGYFDHIIRRARRRVPRLWALWETTRGCPNRCAFCDYGDAAYSQIKRFSRPRVEAELDYLARVRVDLIFCADANFGLLSRDVDLARWLAGTQRRTGYPAQFKANFTQRPADRVLEISRVLHHSGLLLQGVTLAAQSASERVLAEVDRIGASLEDLALLKQRLDGEGIPSYVDMILGLPGETLDSWMQGNCALLRGGHHEDIRLFELYLLPNARLGSAAARQQYGLRTIRKRLNPHLPSDEVGMVDVVVETATLPVGDWVRCAVFSDLLISALHCGGYTRFVSRYLADQGVGFDEFYPRLFDVAQRAPDTLLGGLLHRLVRFQERYLRDHDLPAQGRVSSEPDMLCSLLPYSSPHKFVWWPHDWAWLAINRGMDDFYGQLAVFLTQLGLDPGSPTLADLLRFQQAIMLTPDYDPDRGRVRRFERDWPRYFFGDGQLRQEALEVRFRDRAMGVTHQHPLRRRDRSAFALAALGNYYPDGRYRRFTHQPEAMQTTRIRRPAGM